MGGIGRLLVDRVDGRWAESAAPDALRSLGCAVHRVASIRDGGRLLQRTVFEASDGYVGSDLAEAIEAAACEPGGDTAARVAWARRKRAGVLLGRGGGALLAALLDDAAAGGCEIVAALSSDGDDDGAAAAPLCAAHNVPFYALAAEATGGAGDDLRRRLLRSSRVDVVVVAGDAAATRSLPPALLYEYDRRIIGVAGSLLPAFESDADPYEAAFARGVRVFGSTAFYETPDGARGGPILATRAAPAAGHATAADLARAGAALEAGALVDAVRAHCEDRVLLRGRRAALFPGGGRADRDRDAAPEDRPGAVTADRRPPLRRRAAAARAGPLA